MTPWALLAVLALAACNGTGVSGDGGMDAGGMDAGDVCVRTAAFGQKLENEFLVCELDAGLPGSISTSSEVAQCEQKLDGGCSAMDLVALGTAANCLNELPPLQCAWFATDGGIPLGAIAWAFELYSCEPTTLSASCGVVPGLPLDAGLPF